MQKKSNLFEHYTKEEKEQRAKQQIEREKLAKEVAKLANKCLNSTAFVKYREKYELLERVTIDSLIEYNEQDPMRYAFAVRRMTDELRQLRLLIRTVKADNRVKRKK